MRAFECDYCGNLLFFENVACLGCQHVLGFVPELIGLCAVEPVQNGLWKSLDPHTRGKVYRQCANTHEFQICNWLVQEEDENMLCRACRLNLVIPDLSVSGNLERWRKLEMAKRRVIYTILRLGLPVEAEGNRPALRFKLIGDVPGGPALLTGHMDGVVTVNIAEADDAERERRRVQLGEPYRSLPGHLRHEIAHYYWDRLVKDSEDLEPFRQLFGDERKDYSECLKAHYRNGPPPNWEMNHVTAYASCHPWEDWAETWAHCLHILDTLETAASFGLSLRPQHFQAKTMRAEPSRTPGSQSDFDQIIRNWMPLTHALNELNRGMGLPDIYPFVLSEKTVEKLRWVHRLLTPSTLRK